VRAAICAWAPRADARGQRALASAARYTGERHSRSRLATCQRRCCRRLRLARRAGAQAQVHVFTVQVVAFVEAAEPPEGFGAHRQAQAGQPVDIGSTFARQACGIAAVAEQGTVQQGRWRHQASAVVFCPAVRGHRARRDDADPGVGERRFQGCEHRLWQRQIRIGHQYELGIARVQGGVVIRAEAARPVVTAEFEARAQCVRQPVDEAGVLACVERQHQPAERGAELGMDVLEHARNAGAVAMTDDGDGPAAGHQSVSPVARGRLRSRRAMRSPSTVPRHMLASFAPRCGSNSATLSVSLRALMVS
jgi:hypothetical protein